MRNWTRSSVCADLSTRGDSSCDHGDCKSSRSRTPGGVRAWEGSAELAWQRVPKLSSYARIAPEVGALSATSADESQPWPARTESLCAESGACGAGVAG
jgi:hypothetical protein